MGDRFLLSLKAWTDVTGQRGSGKPLQARKVACSQSGGGTFLQGQRAQTGLCWVMSTKLSSTLLGRAVGVQ